MVVKPTRKGRTLMERGRRNRIDVIRELLDGMTADELAHVDAATTTIARALER